MSQHCGLTMSVFTARGSIKRPFISAAGHARGLQRPWLFYCSAAKVCDAHRCDAPKGGRPGADSCPCSGVSLLTGGLVTGCHGEERASSIIFKPLHSNVYCVDGIFQHPYENKGTNKEAPQEVDYFYREVSSLRRVK